MKAYNRHACIKFKNLNITENVSKGIFSLPLYPNLAEKYVLKISKVLKQILSQNNW